MHCIMQWRNRKSIVFESLELDEQGVEDIVVEGAGAEVEGQDIERWGCQYFGNLMRGEWIVFIYLYLVF